MKVPPSAAPLADELADSPPTTETAAPGDAGAAGGENSLWVRVQLGNLYFNQGDLQRADLQYGYALANRPNYPYALEGQARVRAAQGDSAGAVAIYTDLVQQLPLPPLVS